MQVEELRELNNLLEEADKTSLINDLDIIGYALPDREEERLRSLIDKAVKESYIKSWIENGQGISFTCWCWSGKAYGLSKRWNFDLINPEKDYEDPGLDIEDEEIW